MRIPCPHCGERDLREFVYRGDARPRRPDDGSVEAMLDYIYDRENPDGPLSELWFHVHGCRAWLVVARDTRTHAIVTARLAREAP